MSLTYRAEKSLYRRNAEKGADQAKATLDPAVDAEAVRCVKLVTDLIGDLQ